MSQPRYAPVLVLSDTLGGYTIADWGDKRRMRNATHRDFDWYSPGEDPSRDAGVSAYLTDVWGTPLALRLLQPRKESA